MTPDPRRPDPRRPDPGTPPDGSPEAHHLRVPRTARYYTLGATEAPREVWFVLHGYGQLAAYFIRHFRPLLDGARRIVAPEALSRFYLDEASGRVGASWMTREDRLHEIEDALSYLDVLYDRLAAAGLFAGGAAVHVLGFSQGVATACRWVARGHVPAGRLTCWAGSLPPELDLDALKEKQLTLVAGTADEYATPERVAGQRQRLEAAGLAYDVVTFDGGHRLDAGALRRLSAP